MDHQYIDVFLIELVEYISYLTNMVSFSFLK
ncbi:MAG: hypothetical protein JWR67_1673 [Mucilaginibacter sp.]|nr:hypothetical protein [Mucilaginibacter sp.]